MTKPKKDEFLKKAEEYMALYGETEYKRLYCDGFRTKYVISDKGNVYNADTGKKISEWKNNADYYCVSLTIYDDKGGKVVKNKLVHRLVGDTFLDAPENEDMVVNHKDGNKLNNDYRNLEWVTQTENLFHAIRNGNRVYKNGFENHSNKYSEDTIRNVCKYLAENKYSGREIAKLCGVSHTTVQDIKLKRRYKDISDQYFSKLEKEESKIMEYISHHLEKGEIVKPFFFKTEKTNLYVSNLGKVFNIQNYTRVIPYQRKEYPFNIVALRTLETNTKMTIFVHTLVANTFLDNPQNLRFVIHRNGDPTDDRASNLRFITTDERKLIKKDPLYFMNRP